MIFEVKASKRNNAYNIAMTQAEKNVVNVKKIMDHSLKLKGKEVRYAAVLPNVHRHNASRPEGVYFEDLESRNSFQNWLEKFRPPNGRMFNDDEYDICLIFFGNRIKATRLTASINYIHERLEALTPDQARCLNGVPEVFYIAGPAGSGKTEILIYKAAENNLSNQRKLIVVFHAGLAAYLEWRMKRTPNLEIKTFKKLLLDCIPDDLVRNKYQLDNATLVVKAIQALNNLPEKMHVYESIFVDEAQDLEGGNWELLISLLHKPGRGQYKLIFYDDNQMVRFSNPPKPDQNQIYHLTEVIRNTRNIFRGSLPFYKSERQCDVRHKYDGPEVTWDNRFMDQDLKYYSDNVLQFIGSHVNEIWQDLKAVGPMDICVLVEDKIRADSLISRIVETNSIIVPFTVEEMVANLRHGNWFNTLKEIKPGKQCGVVVDSISRYAGLGSKVVILVIDYKSITAKIIQKVYTGITRPSSKLIVILSTNGQKYLVEKTTGNSIPPMAEPMDID